MGDISSLLAPERVAVVGATDREGSVGRAIVENLQASFEGEVVPVNPNRDAVLGVDCAPDVAAAGAVDLAVVAVPVDAALDVVREIGEAGIAHVVLITAGFGEAGSEGAARERELRSIAAEYDLTLVGPNCIGVLSTPVGLNATFAPTGAEEGSISFLSQSGAVVTAVLDWAREEGIGFQHVVSMGNKAVLDETDFVAAWDEDDGTDVILGYLESVADGQRFLEEASEVTQTTPVVLLKGGRTDAGAKAASSHTGAIAGSDRAYGAAFEQAGVRRAGSIEELFDAGRALSGQPLPETQGVAVVTNAGGAGVLATDAIGNADLELASLTAETRGTLAELLPEGANVTNPVDVIGDADATRFGRALSFVLDDPAVGAVAVLAAPSAVLAYDDLAEAVIEHQRDRGTPTVACLMGGERVEPAAARLRSAGIPNYFDPARAVASLDALADQRAVRERPRPEPTPLSVDRQRAAAVLETARSGGTTQLGVESMALLDAYGIPTPDGEVVSDPAAARKVADDLGGPVVLKIVSPDISHKTDIGGVRVGVEPADVPAAFEDIVSRAYTYQPDARLVGVLVQEQIDVDAGVETIVGVNRDPQFGPVVAFGLGGIFVEALDDAAVRVAPVDDRTARQMTEEIGAASVLRGARGREAVDIDAVVSTIRRIGRLAVDFPAVLELDVNPLVATGQGAVAVDLRVTLDASADEGSEAAEEREVAGTMRTAPGANEDRPDAADNRRRYGSEHR